jgi:sortase A
MEPSTPSNNTSTPEEKTPGGALAADVIRQKIANLYGKEPNASEELHHDDAEVHHRSKHQQFMHELTNSGESLEKIQTTWHNYYVSLPDAEKHAVWQEFYDSHGRTEQPVVNKPEVVRRSLPKHRSDKRDEGAIKKQLLRHVNARGKLQTKHHIQSLLFGLGLGSFIMLIFLFGFFNERFIAPFVSPSKAVSNTPIIIDPNSTGVGLEPKVIIPKINVEIPVVYDEPSIDERALENALERGVVHYATTPNPGERGNAVIFGHSSNNILNKGKYKFAFVLLSRLEIGDTFMLTKNGKRYVYKVYEKRIVKPSEVSVLGNTDKVATATLITCDPPGTSINRLVVIGEQISPDPSGNAASTAIHSDKKPTVVPSNAPTLWSHFIDWLTH